jgi:hypothetical protein
MFEWGLMNSGHFYVRPRKSIAPDFPSHIPTPTRPKVQRIFFRPSFVLLLLYFFIAFFLQSTLTPHHE